MEHDISRPTANPIEMVPTSAPQLAELESYWRELRGARRIPIRTEVDPARIDSLLPHCFVLERIAPGVARFRVAGQALTELFGLEIRGMPLSIMFTLGSRPTLSAALDKVFDGPSLVEFPVQGPRTLLRPRATGRMLILPLLGNDGSVTRAIGGVIMDGPGVRGIRELELSDTASQRCERIGTPELRLVNAKGDAAQPAPSPSLPRSHLRLVINNG